MESKEEGIEFTNPLQGAIMSYYQKKFDRESLDFNRFIVHLRYFAQRLFQAASAPSEEYDADFQEMIIRSCKQHYKCASISGSISAAPIRRRSPTKN